MDLMKNLPKLQLLILALTAIGITAFLTIAVNSASMSKIPQTKENTVVNQAKFLYQQRKQEGENFSSGPCLSNALLPGWVLDIVHNPREKIDDLPQNQCPAYLEGGAEHFVELDPEGNLIRVK